MITGYDELISYEEDEWEDYLNQICLIDIFKDFIKLFKDRSVLRQAIRYVVWTYSKNSDCIVLGTDWLENKKRVFDKCLLPKEYFEDLVLLQNRIVVSTIQRWIDFQDSNIWANLMSLKDLMVEMRVSSNSKIMKSSGEVDYSQKYLNATYVKDLGKMIDDLEQELIQNSPKLKEAARELSRFKSHKNTIGVETFAN